MSEYISNAATSAIDTLTSNAFLLTGIATGIAVGVAGSTVLFNNKTRRERVRNPYGHGCLQGRLLKNRMLPSTDKNEVDGKPPFYFEAIVRVLVELDDKTLLVVPEALVSGEELKEWQRMVFRHQIIEGEAIEFQDETDYSKEKCVEIMADILEKLTNLKIQYIPMPIFDPSAVQSGKFVNRPCVVLYGSEGRAQLYLTLLMGTPKEHKHSKKEACGTKIIFDLNVGEGPEDLQPSHCTMNGEQFQNPHETSILDCTKIAGLPQYKYKQKHLTKIAEPVYVCKKGTKEEDLLPVHALRPVNEKKLRETIVTALTTLTLRNPFGNYVDTTNQYNVGQIVQYKEIDEDGNIVNCREEFTAPPDMYEGPPQLYI